MGGCGSYYVRIPCANCLKPHGGHSSSSAWGHNAWCCSERCGRRLAQRFKNRMVDPIDCGVPLGIAVYDYGYQPDLSEQRIRIKQLEHQLKANGIKPVRASMPEANQAECADIRAQKWADACAKSMRPPWEPDPLPPKPRSSDGCDIGPEVMAHFLLGHPLPQEEADKP